MNYLYRADSAVSLALQLIDQSGNPIAVATTEAQVVDQDGVELGAPGLTVSATVLTIEVPSAMNAIAGDLGTRLIQVAVTDTAGERHQFEAFYGLDRGSILAPGQNSYGDYQTLLGHALFMPECQGLLSVEPGRRALALVQAHHNLGNAPIRLDDHCELDLRDRVRTWGQTFGFTHPSELSPEQLAALPPAITLRLQRAQVAEAVEILEVDPISDRRRTGLISLSHGETTEFYRTAKPLTLPIGRAAAKELGSLLSWAKSIARA